MPKTSGTARSIAAASLVLLAACGSGHPAQAQERMEEPVQSRVEEHLGELPAELDTAIAARLSGAFRAAASRALPAVVYVRVEQERQAVRRRIPQPFAPFFRIPEDRIEVPPREGSGSGFVFDERGYIMTNNHVVEEADRVVVRMVDGREFDAEVVGTDPNTDVAVIKIDPPEGERLPTVQFGDSDRLRVGDWVIALGNPLGQLDFSVTAGIVSAKGRNIGILNRSVGNTALESFIQTDAAINPGNSGGPLVDLLGRVVGINTAIASPTGVFAGAGFAIPVNLARRVARDLIEYGVVHRPKLGVLIQDVDDVDAEVYGLDAVRGAEITAVQPGTPAADAGLRRGDVVLELNGEPVADATELQTLLAQHEPGEEVELVVMRNRERERVEVTLGEFETDREREQTRAERASAAELLGFRVSPITSDWAARLSREGLDVDEGVLITDVQRFGPAVAAGVRRGQVLVAMNGQRIEDVDDVEDIAEDIEPGDVVSLVVLTPDVGEMIINYRTRR